MNRRDFIKSAAVFSTAVVMPSLFWKRHASAALPEGLIYAPQAVTSQFINIFLYGGPSELAGNLTNMEEINLNSQNPYPPYLIPGVQNSVVTKNFFWGSDSSGNNSAGGEIMEELVASGDMSVYRTINRIKDDSKSHGTCIAQNLVGNLNMSNPGTATTLAAIVASKNPYNRPIDTLQFPFVSFEGESKIFGAGNLDIPIALKAVGLNANFHNPYKRTGNSYLSATNDSLLESLAREVSEVFGEKHRTINESFKIRSSLVDFIDNSFNASKVDQNLPTGNPADPDVDDATGKLAYPDTNIGRHMKAAVSLAVSNPDTVFINMGSGGLFGWDEHSNALANYPARMSQLMRALRVAVKHMKWSNKRNIVINVFGDFGRNVNLNNAGGWDHGNNQNLYTLGGWDIKDRKLGKIVGKTKRIGTPFENRQFTSPADGSYQCEPFAIASTIFKYFGVQNPEILTGELPIDEINTVNEWIA